MFTKKISKLLKNRLQRSFYDVPKTKYERNVDQLSLSQLRDREFCKKVLKKRIHQHFEKDQLGLYHGKTNGWKNETCFSDKKHKVYTRVNNLKKEFHSQILDKTFNIYVSTHALRCIRKLGGLDNYILLTYPKNLKSQYGEYLRKMMLAKLNDPAMDVPDMVGESRFKHEKISKFEKRKKKYFGDRAGIWSPPDIRHTDMNRWRAGLKQEGFTPYKFRNELHEINKEMASKEDFESKPQADMTYGKTLVDTHREMMKIYAKEGLENFENTFESKKKRAEFVRTNKEALEFYESMGMEWMK